MQKQLQHTTIVVLLLLVALSGVLYVINSPSLGTSNELTAATVVGNAIDCNITLEKDASSLEKKQYDQQCRG